MRALFATLRRYAQLYSPRPQIHQRVLRRPTTINLEQPIASFTFDDFPRSALLNGGPILQRFGGRATYYASIGLMGTKYERGDELFTLDDLKAAVADGHEIGCHTYSHVGARRTQLVEFEEEILRNRNKMAEILPGYPLQNFCYPGGELTFALKRRMRKYALSSRGTYIGINRNPVDLDLLLTQRLYQSECLDQVKKLVAECQAEPGWLIFHGHDVCAKPSLYGCTPEYLEAVLEIVSGSFRILPIAEALNAVDSGSA